MNNYCSILMTTLQAVAGLQLGIAVLNLFLIPLLNWKNDLEHVSLLLREVFQVHVWFISITLGIFGVITFRFAEELACGSNAMGRWLGAGIGVFWMIRTILQVSFYSASHWRGQMGRTIAHVVLLLTYGAFASVYLWSALARF
jgi:hypothetical protein